MTKNTNYWILVIDSLDIDVSDIEAAEEIDFSYDYTNKKGDFKDLSNNDLILGYNKKFHSLNYLFKTKNISDKELFLEKCFSISKGGLINDSDFLEYKKMLNETCFLQIEEEIFFKLYEILINSIPFCSSFSLNVKKLEPSKRKRNWIFFGAPGTGKSFKLNEKKDELIRDENDYERVTFHPDYSYSSFVGSYKPVQDIDEDTKKPIITYDYVPGPFMRILSKALNDSSKDFLLIIEEINRANVAAVFGDVFQLLDRNESHESEYPIDTSKEMRNYLIDELKDFEKNSQIDFEKKSEEEYQEKFKKIKIPSNMFIWATMNSADQGVFFMDAAFKRRWDFEHVDIDIDESKIYMKEFKFPNRNEPVNWNVLRKAINNILLDRLEVKEDKLLGPFFMSDIVKYKEIEDNDFKDSFKNKVLMYLYEDAAKSNPKLLFKESSGKTYSKLCNNFDKVGIDIFQDNIIKEYDKLKKQFDEEMIKKQDQNVGSS